MLRYGKPPYKNIGALPLVFATRRIEYAMQFIRGYSLHVRKFSGVIVIYLVTSLSIF